MGLVVQKELTAWLHFERVLFHSAVSSHLIFSNYFGFFGWRLFNFFLLLLEEFSHLSLAFLDGQVWTTILLTSDLGQVEFCLGHLNVVFIRVLLSLSDFFKFLVIALPLGGLL